MEYAKYNIKKESWTSRFLEKVKRHKLITTTIIAFLMFASINIIMLYSFMKILQNV